MRFVLSEYLHAKRPKTLTIPVPVLIEIPSTVCNPQAFCTQCKPPQVLFESTFFIPCCCQPFCSLSRPLDLRLLAIFYCFFFVMERSALIEKVKERRKKQPKPQLCARPPPTQKTSRERLTTLRNVDIIAPHQKIKQRSKNFKCLVHRSQECQRASAANRHYWRLFCGGCRVEGLWVS